MYIRKETLRYEKSLDMNDTFKFDELPESGKSAGLLLTITAPTNGGQHYVYSESDDKLRLIDWFDKVQIVVDGKRPIKDLSGAVAQALNYWNTGEVALDWLRDPSIGEDRCFIPIPWGRFIGDTEYYLDWENYKSIELDLKNVAVDPPIDSLVLTLDNFRIVDEDLLPPSKGIFQERIWREWTTVQNETKYFKLPIGNILRRVILRCVPDMRSTAPFRRIRSFYHLAEEVKMAFNAYGETVFDGYGEQLTEQNLMEFPHEPTTRGLNIGLTDGHPVRTGIGIRRGNAHIKGEIATSLTEINFGAYTYTDDIMSVFSDNATNAYFFWMARGLGYNNTMALLFDLYGMEHMINTNEKAPINLDIKTENHADAAAGVNQIILSELVDL